jgi:hypothetical protein
MVQRKPSASMREGIETANRGKEPLASRKARLASASGDSQAKLLQNYSEVITRSPLRLSSLIEKMVVGRDLNPGPYGPEI